MDMHFSPVESLQDLRREFITRIWAGMTDDADFGWTSDRQQTPEKSGLKAYPAGGAFRTKDRRIL